MNIIDLSLEAGAAKFYPKKQSNIQDAYLVGKQFLERFAALVAAAEREACAKVCEQLDIEGVNMGGEPSPAYGNDCAKAIRSRSNK